MEIIKGQIGRQDFNNWEGSPQKTFSRRTTTGGTETLFRIGNEVDVAALYCSSEGDFTAAKISQALNGIGSRSAALVLAPGTWTIDADLTIPANVCLKPSFGTLLSVDTGKTLTVNGPIAALLGQIFTGAGTVTIAQGIIEAEWFGLDASSDETAVNKAIAAGNHVRFSQNLYTDGAINLNKSYLTFEGSREGLRIIPSHTSGNVIYVNGSSTIMDLTVRRFRITPSTVFGDNTLTGIYINNGQRVKLREVEVKDCGTAGVNNLKDSNTLLNCVIWYCTAGLTNGSAAHWTAMKRVMFDNCTTGLLIAGASYVSGRECAWQSCTVGVSITDSASAPSYKADIDGYFEANGTDVAIDGTANYVVAPRISGFINRSASTDPSITLAYAQNPALENLAAYNFGTGGELLSIGTRVEGLDLRNVTKEWYPYIAPTGQVSIQGPMGRTNQVTNGDFDDWAGGAAAAPDGWTLYNCTVAQTAGDERDGTNVAELTATAAGASMYQDITVPPALRVAGAPFILIADVKVASGSGAYVETVPQDAGGNTQGRACTAPATTSASWLIITGRAGYMNASTTRLRVAFRPDNTGTAGVARVARFAVYFGATPWPFER